MVRTAAQKGRLILAAGSVVAAAVGAVALRADLMVGYVFSRALEAQEPVRPFELATRARPRRPAEVGDESYWLSPSGGRAPVLATKERLTVGDRVTVSDDGRLRPVENRRVRHLEVVGIVGAPLLEVVASATPGLHLLVTCRIVDPAEPEGSQELVQLVIVLEKPAKPEAPPQAEDSLGRTRPLQPET